MADKITPAADDGEQPREDVKDIKQFCSRLSESGLIDGATIRTVWESFDDTAKPRNAEELAEELIRRRKLTPYQYKRLKSGDVRGLTIDQYTVLDRIGAGGMGEVLKARHERMQRFVAIKIISEKLLSAPGALERFEQESRAAAQLSHPNIVAAYDAGEKDGTHYLVLEYVDGQDLSTIVQRKGTLRVALALDYILQAAEGLQYSHRKGIVHRDIKPANLLVDSSGVVKILDMGLAFMAQRSDAMEETTDQRLTQQGQVMGTCAYMAPEQAVDVRKADARSDIYSLGCTLYDLLVGRPPYEGETHMAVLVAHREEPIPSICVHRPEVPTAVEEVFRKMVAKKPADRYASMSEVIAALRACTLDGAAKPPIGNAAGAFAPEQAAPPPARSGAKPQAASDDVVSVAEIESTTSDDTLGAIATKHDTVVSRRIKKQRTGTLAKVAVAAVAGLLVIGMLAGGAMAVILSLKTPQGTLLVESDDPDVKIAVKQGGEVVEIVDSADNWKVGLREGKYELEITGGKDQLELDQNVVVVKRDRTERLRVTYTPVAVAELPKLPELPGPGELPPGLEDVAGGAGPVVPPPADPPGLPRPRPRPPIASTTPIVEAIPQLTQLHELLGHRSSPADMVFSPDGKTLASCGYSGRVVLWDVATGEKKREIRVDCPRLSEVAFSPDGKDIAAVGDHLTIAIHRRDTGELVRKLSGISREEAEGAKPFPYISAVAYSPDGKTLLVGDNHSQLVAWDVDTGKQRAKGEGHFEPLRSIAYSPDGKRVATAAWDGNARIWDAETLETVHPINDSSSQLYDCCFSHNGEVLFTAGNSTNVYVWDVETGEQIVTMAGHGGIVCSISLSADGKTLLSTSNTDNSMRFWNVETANTISVLRNSPHQPYQVAFAPHETKVFATAARDGSIRLWKYEGEQEGEKGNLRTLEDGTLVVHQEVGDDHLNMPPWQSFKAPVDGTITSIDLQPNAYQGIQGSLSFYEGTGINGRQLHTQKYVMPSRSNTPWTAFKLTAPLEVKRGETYTWEFTGAGGMKHAKTDRYADGGAAGGKLDMCFRIYFTPADAE